MYKTQKLNFLLLLSTLGLLVASCAKGTEQFIMSSDEEGVICSAKSSFNDTLFYENKFPDTTIYYYALLSKDENKTLKELILNLKQEKSLPQFELHPGSGTFIVESGEVAFYEGNYALPSRNTKKILSLFQKKASAMKLCKKVNDFWNIEGVTPPDNPIP